jgi:hypothetical protein
MDVSDAGTFCYGSLISPADKTERSGKRVLDGRKCPAGHRAHVLTPFKHNHTAAVSSKDKTGQPMQGHNRDVMTHASTAQPG